MTGGGRSDFSENDVGKIMPGSQQVEIFSFFFFFFVDVFVFTIGASPEWEQATTEIGGLLWCFVID
jgi:hypothetical protein